MEQGNGRVKQDLIELSFEIPPISTIPYQLEIQLRLRSKFKIC